VFYTETTDYGSGPVTKTLGPLTWEGSEYNMNKLLLDYTNLSYKLVLHPLSDLTKPIKHKGEEFVTIEMLYHAACEGVVGETEPKGGWYKGGYDLEEYEEDGCQVVKMTPWDERFCAFELSWGLKQDGGIGAYTSIGLDRDHLSGGIIDSKSFWERLYKYHFDTDGLIEAGLAVDVNTLETNPYE